MLCYAHSNNNRGTMLHTKQSWNKALAVRPPRGYSQKSLQLHQKLPYPLQPCGLHRKFVEKHSRYNKKL